MLKGHLPRVIYHQVYPEPQTELANPTQALSEALQVQCVLLEYGLSMPKVTSPPYEALGQLGQDEPASGCTEQWLQRQRPSRVRLFHAQGYEPLP